MSGPASPADADELSAAAQSVPSQGAKARRRNMLLLGVVLLVAFAAPVLGRNSTRFWPCVRVLTDDLPLLLRLAILFPGIAGVALVLVAFGGSRIASLQATTELCLAAAMAVLISLAPWSELPGARVERSNLYPPPVGWLLIGTGVLTWMLLFVGSRAREYAPHSQAASYLGAVGGIAQLGWLVIPALPEETGTVPIVAFLAMLSAGEYTPISIGFLLDAALCVAAGVMCILNVAALGRGQARSRASLAFRLLMAGTVLGLAATCFAGLRAVSDAVGPGFEMLPFAFNVTKVGVLAFASFLLLPFGLIDLIADGPPPMGRTALVGEPLEAEPVGAESTPVNQMRRLKRMLAEGLISEDEFERRKNDVLEKL